MVFIDLNVNFFDQEKSDEFHSCHTSQILPFYCLGN